MLVLGIRVQCQNRERFGSDYTRMLVGTPLLLFDECTHPTFESIIILFARIHYSVHGRFSPTLGKCLAARHTHTHTHTQGTWVPTKKNQVGQKYVPTSDRGAGTTTTTTRYE